MAGTNTVSFRAPPFALFGGLGILLSRGLLDAIPSSKWVRCARQLACGAGDHRLFTCIFNLLPSVCFVRQTHTEDFLRAALDKPDEDALALNAYTNVMWSTMHNDPVRGSRIMRQFSNATAQPRCPWAMHKLHQNCALDVHRVSQHCHADESSAWKRTDDPDATKPCWRGPEAAARERLGLNASVSFEAMVKATYIGGLRVTLTPRVRTV